MATSATDPTAMHAAFDPLEDYLDKFSGHNRAWAHGNNETPHLRHVAKLHDLPLPTGFLGYPASVLKAPVAVTLCGRMLRRFACDWTGEPPTSDYYTDGTRYLKDCPRCVELARLALEVK